MRQFSAEALLLDVQNLHDQDRIVTFLTRQSGKKRGVARGARRKYSRYAGQLQPLTKVMMQWFEKEGRELVRIQGVEVVRSARGLQEDLEGILLSFYLADHMAEFAQEDEPGDALFRLLDSTLNSLLDGIDRDLVARYYEAWMLRLAGVFPAPRHCPLCGLAFAQNRAVLPRDAEALLCPSCAGPGTPELVADGEVLAFLLQISHDNLPTMAARAVEPRVLRQVERITGQVRRHFLQRELKSYEVMKRTLQGIVDDPAVAAGKHHE